MAVNADYSNISGAQDKYDMRRALAMRTHALYIQF